ncbi:MAG: B12-binding domain-containing radical SAM protein [Gammaproteobacteria bacterium]|nr:B12-binding domain-containing radical SAM protein [Gammaproteobacteria bacterium]
MDNTNPHNECALAYLPKNRKPRLLLINPKFPESFWSFRWAVDNVLPHIRSINPPLGLATLAALCPDDWEVSIIDENIESMPLTPQADMVGICGMAIQFQRQAELLSHYRRQGYTVIAGGSYASLCPEKYAALADTVIAGEAETIWPQFCRDWMNGAAQALYQETGTVQLSDSPCPRYDLLKLDLYTTVSMQFSRGCPYRCEFCDIIVMFGRRPRTKQPAQIGKELDQLRAQNVRNVFFVDDNLIGHRKQAKALLRFLISYQQQHHYHFNFGTEVSINLTEDQELLKLFRAANFIWVFVGIESPDKETLQQAGKTQNLRQDLLQSVQTLYQYGITVMAGFIVGFDQDDAQTFDRQYQFINASGIQAAMVGLLVALPKTPLYKRLQAEGRLKDDPYQGDNTKIGTNIIPKRMSYAAMLKHYQALHTKLFSDRSIARRVRNKCRYLKHPISNQEYSLADACRLVSSFLHKGLLRGGLLRVLRFGWTMIATSPRNWRQVITDWITALSMRDYVQRHFQAETEHDIKRVHRVIQQLRTRFAGSINKGVLTIASEPKGRKPGLRIDLSGCIDERFFYKGRRHLSALLKKTNTLITLNIKQLSAKQLPQLEKMLECLAPYGDRITIWANHKLRPLLRIDSSVFHYILGNTGTTSSR